MMTINLHFKGIFLFYRKDNLWKMLFPTDQHHRIRFSVFDEDGQLLLDANGEPRYDEVELAGSPLIKITTNGATTPAAIADDTLDSFVDVTGFYAHDRGVKMRQNWSNSGTLATVANASLSMKEFTDGEFILTKSGSEIGTDLGNIGTEVNAQIVFGNSGELKIEADGLVNPFIQPYAAGLNLTVLFDNDCPEGVVSPNNDFEMYYKIIQDSDDDDVRCSLYAKRRKEMLVLSRLVPAVSRSGRPTRPCSGGRCSQSAGLE